MSENNHNFGVDGSSFSHFIQNIDTSNLVNGKPVYYWIDQQNKQIPNDAGFVGIVNSTNVTVRNLILTNNSMGVLFAYTDNSRIENVTVSSNDDGIYLSSSSNNNLTGNTASGNGDDGICLHYSCNNNILTNNTINSNGSDGIYLYYSSDNTLSTNTINSNDRGIYLYQSSSNLIYNNYLNNTNNARDYGNNIWNITKTGGTNVIGGSYLGGALSKNPVIYHRGDRRGRRVLRLFQSSLGFLMSLRSPRTLRLNLRI